MLSIRGAEEHGVDLGLQVELDGGFPSGAQVTFLRQAGKPLARPGEIPRPDWLSNWLFFNLLLISFLIRHLRLLTSPTDWLTQAQTGSK